VLRNLREDRGESQEALAYRAGITVGSLARIEQGKTNPGWSTVRDIAEALGVSRAELGKRVERQR
jgi:transcriptional regulator with XRE-family HTH domain